MLVVTLKDFIFIFQNLNRQEDKVQINTMQDVTGKVSLGTHSISLDIYYIPQSHELWAPATSKCLFSAKCPLIN